MGRGGSGRNKKNHRRRQKRKRKTPRERTTRDTSREGEQEKRSAHRVMYQLIKITAIRTADGSAGPTPWHRGLVPQACAQPLPDADTMTKGATSRIRTETNCSWSSVHLHAIPGCRDHRRSVLTLIYLLRIYLCICLSFLYRGTTETKRPGKSCRQLQSSTDTHLPDG